MGAAEYFADEVRDTLTVHQTPTGPCEDYLLPGPDVPITAMAGDGTVFFDGDRVRLEWTGFADDKKEKAGPQEYPLSDISGVEWKPQAGMGYGTLRLRIKGEGPAKPPQKDKRCVSWGVQRYGGATALVAAAVLARLPRNVPELPPPPSPGADDTHDAVLRRLAYPSRLLPLSQALSTPLTLCKERPSAKPGEKLSTICFCISALFASS
ncbi:DUF4429 domain-containing protein [Nonomuraea sp. 3N208]|uniref:DUF4429 domain-containing protein n=1 Tax=Nonomuraea sp. 3N208 TaxID=3457421 RepID=UPI003FCDC190